MTLLFDNFRFFNSPIPNFRQNRELFLSYPGLIYSFKPFQNIGFYSSFNFWSGNFAFGRKPTLEVTGIYDESIGKIHKRVAYKFINSGITYQVWHQNKHQINTKIGVSLAFGKDTYLDRINWTAGPDDPLRDFAGIVTHEKNGFYIGGNVGINYDFKIYEI